jgi:poly-gamma-glutamate capsule biosynthesis protein CapA/YwtB (metallophosphatase superfamily)
MNLSFKYFLCLWLLGLVFAGCKKSPQSSVSDSGKAEIKKDSIPSRIEKENLPEEVFENKKEKVFKLKDTVSIIGVGDIMLGTIYPEGINFLAPDDGKFLLKPADSLLKTADITFGNHEGTLFDGKGSPKKCSDPRKCYAFKSPERYAQYLADAGFDLMSIANNHCGDFGPEGRTSTAKVLKAVGIEVAGSIEIPYTIIVRDSIRYGLAAFAPNTGTCRIENIPDAIATIKHLDSLCDIVIVSFHGGAEGKTHQHITRKTEFFYGEDRGNVYEFSHKLIDAGADVIFGHGPHVCRAIELYKGRIIAYSLGNFCTYARFNLAEENAIAPLLKVYTDRTGKFLGGEIFSFVQLGEGGPVPDEEKKAAAKIRELTLADFPETNLIISESGKISIK